MSGRILRHFLIFASLPLAADPTWTAPAELPFGKLGVLELRETDPGRPPLPRPGEDKLGPLLLRAADPTPDGRGWKLTVQPIRPGLTVIPALDLGDGRIAPELRLTVPRTTPYGAPWQGVGGGQEDVLPLAPFPWAWASLPLGLLLLLGLFGVRQWRRGSAHRRLKALEAAFRHAWPPAARDRASLDRIHALGRDLLALRHGEAARAWGAPEFAAQGLLPWAHWLQALDSARFGEASPEFPAIDALLGTGRKEARP